MRALAEPADARARSSPGAIAAAASIDLDDQRTCAIDPDKLLEMEAGASPTPADYLRSTVPGLDFPIDPVQAQTVLNALSSPTGPRARIYDTRRRPPHRHRQHPFPPRSSSAQPLRPAARRRRPRLLRAHLGRPSPPGSAASDLPVYREVGITAGPGSIRRWRRPLSGRPDIDYPRHRARRAHRLGRRPDPATTSSVQGSLLLTSVPGEIDHDHARGAARRSFVLSSPSPPRSRSCFPSSLPARSPRRCAGSPTPPTRVRKRRPLAAADPGLHARGATRSATSARRSASMTSSLYNRIEAIERFAADVAHELKNPLTLAAERGRDAAARQDGRSPQARLSEHHPARRPPARPAHHRHRRRLAPRCRAARAVRPMPIDLAQLAADAVVVISRPRPRRRTARRSCSPSSQAEQATTISSWATTPASSQVFHNLIDNARSFSPPGIDASLCRRSATARQIEVTRRRRGARHPPGRRWIASSSASIPTGPTQDPSARIPASACRSPSRSSRRIGTHLGRERHHRRGPAQSAGARFVVRLPALRVTASGAGETIHASAAVAARPGRSHPRRLGPRQIQPSARPHRRSSTRRDPLWQTTAFSCDGRRGSARSPRHPEALRGSSNSVASVSSAARISAAGRRSVSSSTSCRTAKRLAFRKRPNHLGSRISGVRLPRLALLGDLGGGPLGRIWRRHAARRVAAGLASPMPPFACSATPMMRRCITEPSHGCNLVLLRRRRRQGPFQCNDWTRPRNPRPSRRGVPRRARTCRRTPGPGRNHLDRPG